MRTMDLNADLGEGGEQDEAMMSLATSVNIACGGHAGDPQSIRRAVEQAIQAGAAIGAHPGYEDPLNFGRRAMEVSEGDLRDLMRRQLERILEVQPQLHHVKPHGALYNKADRDQATAETIVSVVAALQPGTMLYCPPAGELAKAAGRASIRVCGEGFIDRRYLDDGSLCPRSELLALIDDFDEIVSQALKITLEHAVTTIKGTTIPLQVRTLCVHGDSPDALEVLRLTRSFLEEAGVEVAAP